MEKKLKYNKLREEKGITIISLVITIIVLLILSGFSLSIVFNQNGIFKRAEGANDKYSVAEAREALETVLLTYGRIEKQTNPLYNQDDNILDTLIETEIPGSEVRGNIVIIGEHAFEIDRSVPKIGTNGNNGYLGKEKDLIFPTVTVAEVTQADAEDNNMSAKIAITATIDEKAKKGIQRIEIWQKGVKIDTIECNNEKTITIEYKVSINGVYTIKVWADLSESATTTVEGITPAVDFLPNGSAENEWKQEYTTQITVRETGEGVTSIKYKWTTDETKAPDKFTEECPEDNKIIGNGEANKTETYYLWILITTGTGEKARTYTCRSKGFNFDNKGPTVELTSTPTSNTSFTLKATASDTESGIASYEFYVDGVKVDTQNTNSGFAEYTYNSGEGMIEAINSKVIVRDGNGNPNEQSKDDCRTKLYKWSYQKATKPGVREFVKMSITQILSTNFGAMYMKASRRKTYY